MVQSTSPWVNARFAGSTGAVWNIEGRTGRRAARMRYVCSSPRTWTSCCARCAYSPSTPSRRSPTPDSRVSFEPGSYARVAGRGMLPCGRTEVHVSLVELPVEDRARILCDLPRLVPQGVPFFTRLYGVTADPEQFACLAETWPGLPDRAAMSSVSDLTNHALPRSIYGVMKEQNGGSDAQLFHDRSRI